MNWPLFQNSLLVATGATLLALLLGTAVALWLLRLGRIGKSAVIAGAVVAFALPPFLPANCWLDLLGPTGRWIGWLPLPIMTLPGTVWLLALMHWPVATGFVWSVWRNLPRESLELDPLLRDAALGRWVLWPAGRRSLAAAASTLFVLTLNQFTLPALLQVKVFPAEVWVGFNTTFDYSTAWRVGWPMLVVALAVLWWVLPGFRVSGFRTTEGTAARSSATNDLFRSRLQGAWSWLPAIVGGLALTASVGLPLVHLAQDPRTWKEFGTALDAGHAALGWSVALALGTAAIVVGLGILASGSVKCWPDSRRRLGRVWMLVPWLLFLVPGVVLGIALIWLLNRPATGWFYDGFGVVLFAWTLRYAAPGLAILAAARARLDPRRSELVRMEGGSRWAVLRWATWPQVAPAATVAGYAVFLLCLWDVETLVLIVPPGLETLSLRIFNLLHYGHNSQVNALCLLLLGVAVAPLLLLAMAKRILRRSVALLCMVPTALLLAGCAPQESRHAVDSRFFDEARVIGSRGVGPGQFNKPRSLAVDRDDNVYVVDITGRAQKFAPDGRYLLGWQMPETDKGKAKGMFTDPAGGIVVVEPHYTRVNHYDATGRVLSQWGLNGTNAGQLAFPRSIAVGPGGDLFISEYSYVERIQHFGPGGTNFLGAWGRPGEGEGEFNRVEGLGLAPDGLVYAADSCNHRVQVFTPEGKYVRQFGRAGSGPGELSYPYDVRIDAAGNVFVCEFGNSRIQVFDATGKSVEIIGGPGGAPGRFTNPWSICLDSRGNLYVADSQNHRVQKLVRRTQVAGGGWQTVRIALAAPKPSAPNSQPTTP